MKAYADTNLLARIYIEQMANADSDNLLAEVRTGLVEPLPVTRLLEIEFTAALELYVYFGRQGKEPRITPEQAAIAHADFAGAYAKAMIANEQAKGVSGAALDHFKSEMEQFKLQYANPLYRWPMTFIEIFPVGVIVSLVSAGLLRNSRFMPARPRAGA